MNHRIALGFGNNVDYEIIWDDRIVAALIQEYDIRADELRNDDAIKSERDLLSSILDFMRRGRGGERFVESNDIIECFARRFRYKITLGGTPVRAAIAMNKLGYAAALHLITINDDVRRLLPAGCPYVCSNPRASSYPHLIVQFQPGKRVRLGDRDIAAESGDRLIYHSNPDNIAMCINEDFGDLISGAEVMLVSGFNAVQREAQLSDRLEAVGRMLDRLPESALVYSEDAGNMRAWHYDLLFRKLGQRVDIFGMNEDELQAHARRRMDLLDASEVMGALEDLSQRIPVPIIVAHTRFWALAYGEGAERFRGALLAGADLATTRFRHGDDFGEEEYRMVSGLPRNRDGAAFANAIARISGGMVACAPVADVAQDRGTTIGLGDAFVGGFLPALLGE